MSRSARLLLACLLAPAVPLLPSCSVSDAVATGLHSGNAVRGATAFVNACSSCHASGDGYDLAYFGFTDTTIVRRAVRHVDTLTAYDIVAHIHALKVAPLNPQVRPFQPGGVVLASDLDFANALFGSDHWPAGLTTAQLRAIDPRLVRVAVPTPQWADEEANLDWMPDSALPLGILDDQGEAARAAIAGYRAAPTIENLTRTVAALRSAERRTDNPDAPCLDLETLTRVNFPQCFEVRRWTATLVGQHLLRNGIPAQMDASLHDIWWDVGNVARKSISAKEDLPNAQANWAAWMYLAWSFGPSLHATVYTGGGLKAIGLTRHATFLALRSAVARPAGSETPYEDVAQAAAFAPATWAYDVADFGFRHLLARIAAGDVPPSAQLAQARDRVSATLTSALKKVPTTQSAALTALRDQVLAALPAQ